MSEEEVKKKWPLHWMVWNDDPKALERTVKSDPEVCEALYGTSGLHLSAEQTCLCVFTAV